MRTSVITAALAAAPAALAIPAPAPSPVVAAPLAARTPPGIPSASSAKSMLSGLTVATPQDDGSYDRDEFPHWISQGGSCNTREEVLKRDGQNVEVGSNCAAESGTWTSPYDGGKWTQASDVDIDHMVPLKNAWISGASKWTKAQRQAFANDLDGPQLWAVTDEVNQSKSDKSPDEWKPPLTSFYCIYARAWVAVKDKYNLAASSSEVDALTDMLSDC